MANQQDGDFYTRLKHHLFQIFNLILCLFAMWEILVKEAPHIPTTPSAVQTPQTPCAPSRRGTARPGRKKKPRRKGRAVNNAYKELGRRDEPVRYPLRRESAD